MIPRLTRAQRDLLPYVSPVKDWDDLPARPTLEVVTKADPSQRPWRRQRRRDALAMGRKSRSKAFQKAQAARHNEENLLGMARVRIGGRGTPAMRENVERAISNLARVHAKEQGSEDVAASIAEIDGMLEDILKSSGEWPDARDEAA